MRRRGERVPREKVAEEEVKSAGRKAEQGAEQYQCSGLLEQDFPELCARAGIAGVPRVTLRPSPSFPAEGRSAWRGTLCPNPPSTRCWGATACEWEPDRAPQPAASPPRRCRQRPPCPRCPSRRLAHLSLRNNSIGDAAARRIGQSLSCNRSLVSLSLSFNRISDLGAADIAQGLRLNRSLLSLSLANNDIGDAGATRLAEVLGPFALTHAEVVERRRLLWAEVLGRARTTSNETEGQSERFSSLRGSAAAPDTLPPAKYGKKKKEPLRKEETRQAKKPPEPRGARGKAAKPSGQEKLSPELLLEEAKQHAGSVILPGNRALLNLNLSHNHVTERGLGALLAALERQRREAARPGKRGLLCLSLEGNRIPPTSPAFARLQELLLPLDSLRDEEEEEDGGA